MLLGKILRNEIIWVTLIIGCLLFLAYSPIIHNFRTAPPDRWYWGGEEYPLDMAGDMMYVQEGYHGQWLATSNISVTLVDKGSLVKFEYIAIGHLSRITRTDPLVMFFVARALISLVYLVCIYLVIRTLWKQLFFRICTFLLVLFGAGVTLPNVGTFVAQSTFDALVFNRLTLTMPHYLLGGLCSLVSLFCLSNVLEHPRRHKTFIISVIFGALSSFFYAPAMVLLVSGFPLYILFSVIHKWTIQKRFVIDGGQIGILFAYAVIALSPVAYVRYVVSYVWKDFSPSRMETLNPFSLTYTEYLLAVGVTYVVSVLTLPRAVRLGKPLLMMLGTWIIMHPVGEYVISPLLGLNPIRYFLTPYFLAYGILAAEGINGFAEWVSKRVAKLPSAFVCLGLIAVILSTSMFTYRDTYRRGNICFCMGPLFDFAYPKKSLAQAIRWISNHTKSSDIVLTYYYSGTLVSAFAGNPVYVSWWYNLVNPPNIGLVSGMLQLFYTGTMTNPEAKDFLAHTQASYIVYSDNERALGTTSPTLPYPFLQNVFEQEGVIVYRVVR